MGPGVEGVEENEMKSGLIRTCYVKSRMRGSRRMRTQQGAAVAGRKFVVSHHTSVGEMAKVGGDVCEEALKRRVDQILIFSDRSACARCCTSVFHLTGRIGALKIYQHLLHGSSRVWVGFAS